jgi:Polyketide cyclase / dehydrase and lipid transport
MQTAFILLALVVLVVLIYASTKPGQYTISRSVSINAGAEKIHATINTPREFERWSPYSPKDPQMSNTYSGPERGVGARNEFVGNGQVGSGSVEIIRSTPPSEVVMRLIMIKPFAADNEVTYSIAPQGAACQVTWAMKAKAPFFVKLMSVFINMDKMIGQDFEVGLGKLKVLMEAA